VLRLWKLAKLNGMAPTTLRNRVVRRGWTMDRALTEPVRFYKKSQTPHPTKDCAWCGETFSKSPSSAYKDWERRRYCSRPCRWEYEKDVGTLFKKSKGG
jgi:hypothetical protein